MSGDGAEGTVLTWVPGRRCLEAAGPAPGVPLIIDSWLVENGRARALERHQQRFARSCEAVGASRLAASTFFECAVSASPRQGRWWPRVALCGMPPTTTYTLWLRPAPVLKDSAQLWVAGSDERRRPGLKGYDLGYLGHLGRCARAAGASEALILSSDGRALEGATTSLLWWSGGVLCAPLPGPRLLAGVTSQVVLDIARGAGQAVDLRDCWPPQLQGCEVWVVNALHGIRSVDCWTGPDGQAGPVAHRAAWAAMLAETSAPI